MSRHGSRMPEVGWNEEIFMEWNDRDGDRDGDGDRDREVGQ
jgi:hypothetical protein